MEIRYTDNFPPPKFAPHGGIIVVCETCKEETRFRYQSPRDSQEYDRFVNDCVQTFAARHPCVKPGSRALVRSVKEED